MPLHHLGEAHPYLGGGRGRWGGGGGKKKEKRGEVGEREGKKKRRQFGEEEEKGGEGREGERRIKTLSVTTGTFPLQYAEHC